jgi:hypothetical protein
MRETVGYGNLDELNCLTIGNCHKLPVHTEKHHIGRLHNWILSMT